MRWRDGFELCVLALLLVGRGGLRALRRNARPLLVQGIAFSAIPFVLLAWASLSMSAGLTAILNATSPLFAAIAAHLWLAERIGRWRALGLATRRPGSACCCTTGWCATSARSARPRSPSSTRRSR
jgi:hypothetical protein